MCGKKYHKKEEVMRTIKSRAVLLVKGQFKGLPGRLEALNVDGALNAEEEVADAQGHRHLQCS